MSLVLNVILRYKFITDYKGGNINLEKAIIRARTIKAVKCSRKIESEGIPSSHVQLAQVKKEQSDLHQHNQLGTPGRVKCKVCGISHGVHRKYVCNQCGIKDHLQNVYTNKQHFNPRN